MRRCGQLEQGPAVENLPARSSGGSARDRALYRTAPVQILILVFGSGLDCFGVPQWAMTNGGGSGEHPGNDSAANGVVLADPHFSSRACPSCGNRHVVANARSCLATKPPPGPKPESSSVPLQDVRQLNHDLEDRPLLEFTSSGAVPFNGMFAVGVRRSRAISCRPNRASCVAGS